MEWFGLSLYGVPDPVKDFVRADYKEPEEPLELDEVIRRGTKKSFSELVSELDLYIGRADGYSYRSYDRLNRCRKKGIFKPVGPPEMYSYEGTESMKTSYWLDDPALKGQTWYKQKVFKPLYCSDVTIFFNEAKKKDKFFKL